MIAWLRSRRALLADLDRQRNMLATRDAEIRNLNKLIGEQANDIDLGYGRAIAREQEIRRAHDATRDQLATVREELAKLRDEIRAAERADRAAPGMARYLDRPLIWQTADAIKQDAAHKRLDDGAEDDR